MAIVIHDKAKCTGCGACWNVCPKDCIDREIDKTGFMYPVVDIHKCVECHLCEKVCPIINPQNRIAEDKDVYAAWSKDSQLRFQSTSGGAFSEIAYSVLDKGGYIVGAAYNENNMVHHIMVSSKEGIDLIRQSKYIQSDTEYVFRSIREMLQKKEHVLYCGAPCQVAGLKSFLRKDYEQLYTVDFICRGMNSPKAYQYWLEELEDSYHSKIRRVWFKYKENGWKRSPFCTRVDFQNGETFISDQENNSFMQGYLKSNLYIRPSCGKCLFKGDNHFSDITLADFWKIDPELDDDQGVSMVMVNSDKGKKLFENAKKHMEYYKKDIAEIKAGNICFEDSVVINPKGEEFLALLGSESFSKLVKKYTAVPISKRILKKIKKVLMFLVKKSESR